jgi:hypothetical protein
MTKMTREKMLMNSMMRKIMQKVTTPFWIRITSQKNDKVSGDEDVEDSGGENGENSDVSIEELDPLASDTDMPKDD